MTSPSDLLAFLGRVDSYPHPTPSVEIRQTHISIVALASPYVYKVKKPLNLGFLDFSTLEKRRHFCEEELRLNRRLTDDVYLELVPISLCNSDLAFGDKGEIVDYAVKMRLLEESGFLHRRLEDARSAGSDLRQVAERLAAFYQAQDSTPEIMEWGRIEKLRVSTDENFTQIAPFVGSLLSEETHSALQLYTERFYVRHAALFARRCHEGSILDCHGDLRSEHIHFDGNVVNIFDCIEFNQRFHSIDVANDVAFLAMDLDFRGRPDLASKFLSLMSTMLDDPELLVLADFYKCYRAQVRGKVAALRTLEMEVPACERDSSREMARHHFQLGLTYAVASSKPLVLAVMGQIATGKSTIARILGEALGWEVVASDVLRKELAGIPRHIRFDSGGRRELYSEEMTSRTYQGLIDRAFANATRSRSTIIDATFGKRAYRELLRETAHRAGIRCCFVEMIAPDDEIRARLARREQSVNEISDARLSDFGKLSASYEPPPSEGEEQLRIENSTDACSAISALFKTLIARQ